MLFWSGIGSLLRKLYCLIKKATLPNFQTLHRFPNFFAFSRYVVGTDDAFWCHSRPFDLFIGSRGAGCLEPAVKRVMSSELAAVSAAALSLNKNVSIAFIKSRPEQWYTFLIICGAKYKQKRTFRIAISYRLSTKSRYSIVTHFVFKLPRSSLLRKTNLNPFNLIELLNKTSRDSVWFWNWNLKIKNFNSGEVNVCK